MSRKLISTIDNTQLTICRVRNRSIQFQSQRKLAICGTILIAIMRTLTYPLGTMRIDSSTPQLFRIPIIWTIMEEVITSVKVSDSRPQDLGATISSLTIMAQLYWTRSIKNRRVQLLINSKRVYNLNNNSTVAVVMLRRSAKERQH